MCTHLCLYECVSVPGMGRAGTEAERTRTQNTEDRKLALHLRLEECCGLKALCQSKYLTTLVLLKGPIFFLFKYFGKAQSVKENECNQNVSELQQ